MSIGIYDADMATYTLVPFNLQAMKLSAYYKKQRELVVLAKQFDITRNTQLFYVKDWNDGNFPTTLNQSKVQYLGHAFSGKQYIALDEDIEKMKPDTSLYNIMEQDIMGTGATFRKKIFTDMMTGEHCRISLDGINVWDKTYSQFKNLEKCKSIMFHDYDLAAIEGSWQLIQDILSNTKRNPQIGMKFPVNLSDGESLIKWSSLRPNAVFYSMRYNGLIDNNVFTQWLAQCYNRLSYSQLEYNISSASAEEVIAHLRDLYQQIVISRSYCVKISLRYTEDFFPDKRYAQLIDLFNYYQHSMWQLGNNAYLKKAQSDTLFDFAKKSLNTYGKYAKMLTRDEIKQLFHFVGEINPDLFKDFYELTAQDFMGGQI